MIPLLARSACARTGLGRTLQAVRASAVRFQSTRPPTPALASKVATTTLSSPPPNPAPLAAPTTAFDRFIPSWAERAKPFLYLLRLDKPIGAILLFWPCAWSITMACTATAAPVTTGLWYIGLFGLGAVIMRGAGCIINDMWDAKVDAKVERTANRPLAAGTVSKPAATVFLGTQLLLGLGILTQLNTYSILLGMASLPLVAIYPFMKRVTYYPQIVLGLCFEWGALLGWSAVAGTVDWSVAGPLYAGCVLYCVGYDTIYAHQDKRDDVLAGVKSTALAWGDKSKPAIASLYAAFIGCLTVAGHAMGAGPLYYAISCLGGAAHLAWQVITVDLDSRPDCWNKFTSNGLVTGPIIWAGMAADYVQQVLLPFM